MKVIDAHIHLCRCVNGFGAEGELQAVGGGWVEYASGNRFQMFPPVLGETDVTPEALARAAKRHPTLTFVVCHLLAPQGLAQQPAWEEGLRALNLENVVFDLASLPANQKPEAYPYPTAVHYTRRAGEILGRGRMMWGSDLPSNLCRDTYRHLIDHILCSDAFTDDEKEELLYTTAARVYFGA